MRLRAAPGRPASSPARASSERAGRGAPTDWLAFVPDRAPAYITWEEYEANLAQLAANRAWTTSRGAARTGAALLAGLVSCARCGTRLIVRYDGTPARPTYVCAQRASDYGEPHCQQVAAAGLDRFVREHVLAALEPAALELALTATRRIERERAELLRHWEQRRERAAYEAERARRQYDAVEPENRLVARTLERRWEERLAAQQQLEEAYRRALRELPRTLSEEERATIRRLAADIPALWTAPTTTNADRKELIRQVVERVVVGAQGASERVQVRIEWVGGEQTQGVVRRPIQRTDALSTYPEICERVRAGVQAGLPAASIADRLNAEGYLPPRGERFGVQAIRVLRQRLGLSGHRPHRRPRIGLGSDEWWRSELGRTLGIPTGTLDSWIERGWVRARQEPRGLRRWIVWADPAEVERLRQFRQRPLDDAIRQRWLQRQGGSDDPTP